MPLLEQARRKTKPRTVDLYEVFCAVLYLLRTGCQWRALPSDFPKWRTVHSYFAKSSEQGNAQFRRSIYAVTDKQGANNYLRALKATHGT